MCHQALDSIKPFNFKLAHPRATPFWIISLSVIKARYFVEALNFTSARAPVAPVTILLAIAIEALDFVNPFNFTSACALVATAGITLSGTIKAQYFVGPPTLLARAPQMRRQECLTWCYQGTVVGQILQFYKRAPVAPVGMMSCCAIVTWHFVEPFALIPVASSRNLLQIQHLLFMNLLLGDLGGQRPIFQYHGLLQKPIANPTLSLYEFALGWPWRPMAHQEQIHTEKVLDLL